MNSKKILKKLPIFCLIVLLTACCSKNPLKESNESKPVVQPGTEKVIYSGNETLQEMIANYQIFLDSGYISPFSESEKQEMIDSFTVMSGAQKLSSAASVVIIAYTSHYVWSGTDKDLWLEYKWWAGSPQGYHFETPIWSLYWAIRICYGGRITNWWWMEGSYQRVTAVVGSCVYIPFGSSFTQYYLRVVSP